MVQCRPYSLTQLSPGSRQTWDEGLPIFRVEKAGQAAGYREIYRSISVRFGSKTVMLFDSRFVRLPVHSGRKPVTVMKQDGVDLC
jgi:hypothetical protein